jgi:hypothetical protein
MSEGAFVELMRAIIYAVYQYFVRCDVYEEMDKTEFVFLCEVVVVLYRYDPRWNTMDDSDVET